MRFSAYLVFMTLFTIFVYCPLAHWTWHPQGFLRVWGVLDFAGGTVVHMSAGVAALAGAMFLGPRRAYLEGESHVASNVPYVLLGTGMLWFGWFGFNAGSALGANATAAMAVATTNTASAAAMLTWILFDTARGRRPSALGACIGAVVGLVAITPAAGYVSIGHSVFIGVLASVVSNWAVHVKSKSDLDDTLDVFPCHGVGGMVGMLATGLLARDVGLLSGQTHTMLLHLLALVLVSTFAFVMSYLLYWITDKLITLRVPFEEEAIGLDISQHNEYLDLEPYRQFGGQAASAVEARSSVKPTATAYHRDRPWCAPRSSSATARRAAITRSTTTCAPPSARWPTSPTCDASACATARSREPRSRARSSGSRVWIQRSPGANWWTWSPAAVA